MLKIGRFYQTTQNHNLLASDRAAPESKRDRAAPESKRGGKVMCIVPMGAMVLLTKHGRWRYVQVIYKDMIGFLWLPTNISTHEVFREWAETEKRNQSDSFTQIIKRRRGEPR
jgi:hypothetical protein